ncbi:MAG: NYN domain-containing protein [bacterium]|nr:NYN domain-containing protein [bacterium]
MFNPKTQKISDLASKYPERINELDTILNASTKVYIDYANVRPWSERLKWHIYPKRVKQFLESFSGLTSIKFYAGELKGDIDSETFIKEMQYVFGQNLISKSVKIMNLSIDVSSIPKNDPAILKNFIRPPLLKKLTVQTIELLNGELEKLNQQGTTTLEDRKCNFDVEIGTDMLLDLERNNTDVFILWSGDSDFADPISKILSAGKKAYLFATSRRVASELNDLRANGLFIFDIQKIRDFICWSREITS